MVFAVPAARHLMFLFALSVTLQGISTQARPPLNVETIPMDTQTTAPSGDNGMNTTALDENVAAIMNEAIREGKTPGGVVLVLRNGEPVLHQAYGNRSVEPTTEPATLDTIYDMASLTKPMATATSIMTLVEQGKLRLTDPVKNYFPEWTNTSTELEIADALKDLDKAISLGKVKTGQTHWDTADNETADLLARALTLVPPLEAPPAIAETFDLRPRDRESITIRHLLTHTSGLASFVRYYERYPEGSARDKIIQDIATSELRGPVGGQFIYSDLGFIVLGELVERVSGKPLDEYAEENIFRPLQMNDTMFTPPTDRQLRIAPTEWREEGSTRTGDARRVMIQGEVHDGNARVQDGVSGHAGLFSTSTDLARYFNMMMNGGEYQGARILSPATIRAMTTNHANLGNGGPGRGYGWDLTSSFSSQKGDIFSTGYGHTGFTGTSVWVVPEEKLAIIILTNRVHPDGKGDVVPLRAKIANIVAGSIIKSYKNDQLERTE